MSCWATSSTIRFWRRRPRIARCCWTRHLPAAVLGDEELIRRAVENVIRNAIRYAPPGTSVNIELRSSDNMAQIRVRDYGPGVPEEALSRIFDPFYRVDSDRNRMSGGMGLGLAIARRSVELHKGKLTAQNAHPGLLVTMEFPATAPRPSLAKPPKQATPVSTA